MELSQRAPHIFGWAAITLGIGPHSSSIFFLFSSPNLSRCRLDVCHSSTHGVALVQIYDAGLKRAAGGSLKIQDAIGQLCRAISSQLRHAATIGKTC